MPLDKAFFEAQIKAKQDTLKQFGEQINEYGNKIAEIKHQVDAITAEIALTKRFHEQA